MSKTIKQWITACHQNAVRHGFFSDKIDVMHEISLCADELTEAINAYTNGEAPIWLNNDKPDGWAVEMADCVMRIMSLCGQCGIDLEDMIEIKYSYNKNRPYKHGKE